MSVNLMSGNPAPSRESLKTDTDAAGEALQSFLMRGIKIPAQPRVVEELRQILMRGEFDVRPLARVINRDPGITAMLFKVCGTPAYRQHHPFRSLDQILHTLGVKQTFNLIQAIALMNMGGGKQHSAAYEAFWARSQTIAQLAMLVSEDRVSVCNIYPDEAYLAGIFHDCGVPLLMQRFPTYCAEMRLGEPGRWIELEEEDRRFSANHCVVGYLVAKHWNLPDYLCDAIRNHHDMTGIGMHESRTMVAILQMAIELYYRDQHVVNPEWLEVAPEVLGELGIHEDSASEFIDIMLERFHEQE